MASLSAGLRKVGAAVLARKNVFTHLPVVSSVRHKGKTWWPEGEDYEYLKKPTFVPPPEGVPWELPAYNMRVWDVEKVVENLTMNFGPQHPAAHGVLRLVLTCDGETVVRADPHIGLLHRATEKLIEHKTYTQALPYFDRLDYVSMMINEQA